MRVARSSEEFHNTVTRLKDSGGDPQMRDRCRTLADVYEKELDQLIARLRSFKPTPENARRLQQALEHKATVTQYAGFLTSEVPNSRPSED